MSRLVFILLFVLSSCSAITHNFIGMGNFAQSDAFYQRFPENKKSLVIMGYDFHYRHPIYWCKVDNLEDEIIDVETCKEFRISNAYKIMVLESGLYKMVTYDANKDDFIFGKKESRIASEKSLYFELSSGQVVYIGKLAKEAVNYTIKDEYDKMLHAIKSKNYQELSTLLTEPLDKLVWFVELKQPILKKLALQVKDTKKAMHKKSDNGKKCQAVCDKKEIRQRQREIDLDRHKYNQKYLNQLIRELNFDKKRCGIK